MTISWMVGFNATEQILHALSGRKSWLVLEKVKCHFSRLINNCPSGLQVRVDLRRLQGGHHTGDSNHPISDKFGQIRSCSMLPIDTRAAKLHRGDTSLTSFDRA